LSLHLGSIRDCAHAKTAKSAIPSIRRALGKNTVVGIAIKTPSGLVEKPPSNRHRERDVSEREFLFEYRFDGAVYGLPVVAKDVEMARRKISAMSFAIYKGEVATKIPLSPRADGCAGSGAVEQ
jgi:hypothetical protein